MSGPQLDAFLPREVRHAVATGIPLPTRASGVALFADLSGFSTLSTALAREVGETAGAELLAGELERAFEALVTPVHRFGGSVIGFSGDAVTCWFDATRRDAEARAVAAGLQMIEGVAALPPVSTGSEVTGRLGIKVGAAGGSVRRLFLGRPSIQSLEAMAGPPMERMADAEGLAEPAELVVDDEVASRLDGLVVREQRRSHRGDRFHVVASASPVPPCPWPEAPGQHDDYRPWLPPRLDARLARGESAFIGAFRPVVALFTHFTGRGDEALPTSILESLVARVQEIVDAAGGHVVDVTIGDKGSYLFAAFGALGASEDSTTTALRAALEIRDHGGDWRRAVDLRMGVSKSRVYTGVYGCPDRRTFGVVGRQVNTAARLMMEAAPGEVLVTPLVATEVHAFDVTGLPERTLKGEEHPMAPLRLEGERRRGPKRRPSARAEPLIGRRAEQDRIAAALDRLGDGVGGTILIEGDAGMGKSRLLEHAYSEASAMDVATCWCAADSTRDSTPYYPWRGLFEDVLGLAGDDDPNPRRRRERCLEGLEALDDALTTLAPLLNPVVAVDFAENATTAQMDGRVRSQNTQELLRRLFQAHVGSGPMVLLVEDLHWFDSASVALLSFLNRDIAGCLTVATRRPMSESGRAMALSSFLAGAETLPMGRMEPEEVAALLKHALGVSSLPAPLLTFVEAKGEGSPFHSQEIAYSLRHGGHLVVEGETARLGDASLDLDRLEFPDTVQGVIGSRIDGLPPPEQLAIKVASVLGREFSVDVLRAVLPVDADRAILDASLAALEDAELTARSPTTGGIRYHFRHALTHDVAYDMLLHRQRSDIHLAVAAWYEREHAGDLTAHYPTLAHHMGRAARSGGLKPPDISRAIEYLEGAGLQSVRNHANDEAVDFFRTLIEIEGSSDAGGVDGADRRAIWHARLATAHLGRGEFRSCQESARAALRLLGHPVPDTRPGLVIGFLRHLSVLTARRFLGRNVQPQRPHPSAAPRLLEVAAAGRLLSKALFHDNAVLAMSYLNAHGLRLAQELGPGAELALAQSHALLTLGLAGARSTALDFGRHAFENARQAGQATHLATIHVNHGMFHLCLGEWDEALRLLHEGEDVARDVGDTWQWGEMRAQVADIALLRGDLDLGKALYADVFQNAEPRSMYLQMAWCLRPAAIEALRHGEFDRAVDLVEGMRGLWGEVPDYLMRIDALGFLAQAHALRQDVGSALAAIRDARAIVEHVTPPIAYPRIFGYSALCEACLTLWSQVGDGDDEVGPRKLARWAVRAMATYARSFPIGRPAARLYSGWYDHLAGQSSRARRKAQDAVREATSLDMPYEEGKAYALLAELSQHPTDRRRHLEAAKEALSRSSAIREARRVEDALNRVLKRSATAA